MNKLLIFVTLGNTHLILAKNLALKFASFPLSTKLFRIDCRQCK